MRAGLGADRRIWSRLRRALHPGSSTSGYSTEECNPNNDPGESFLTLALTLSLRWNRARGVLSSEAGRHMPMPTCRAER
jgi:hypothetical protein